MTTDNHESKVEILRCHRAHERAMVRGPVVRAEMNRRSI